MSDYAHDDPTGPVSLAETSRRWLRRPGRRGHQLRSDPDADSNTDLMRPDSDPLPDAQVPGISPDSQAPTDHRGVSHLRPAGWSTPLLAASNWATMR